MRASSSHSCSVFGLDQSVRSWSLSVSLSKWKETCFFFHVLKFRLQTEYMFLAIDTKRKTRWTYVIFLNSSSVPLLITAFRTSASVIRLRRLYVLEHPVVHRISPVPQLCPERGVSLPVLVTAIHVRRAVFDYLNSESCVFRLPSYSAFPSREHGARSAWFLSTLNSCFVECFTDTSISVRRIFELPKCSSVDWNRHAPQLRTIYGVHWFSWVKIEMSTRRVKSTRRVMMRLRRQNHKTKIRRDIIQ